MTLVARRAGATAMVAGAVLLLAAPSALATVSASSGGTAVNITSDSGDDSITVACTAGAVTVNAIPVAPPLTCSTATAVYLSDDGGTDTINLGQVDPASFPALTFAQIDVEDGVADTLTGGGEKDFVTADNNDVVASGGGNDRIEGGKTADGGAGDDFIMSVQTSVQGGTGDDTVYNPGLGPIDGGPGSDTGVLDASVLEAIQNLNVQVTDSGLVAQAPGTAVTTPIASIEEWIITALAGDNNDVLDSRSYSGRVVLRSLGGNDTLSGGVGQDYLDGGTGNDVLDGGAGADDVRGGPGNDSINSRDGVADIVDCGDGTDVVSADIRDVLVNCESASIPPPDTAPIVGPKKVIKGAKAVFLLGQRAQDYAGAGFEARIDNGPFKPVTSPWTIKTKKLKLGKHTLTVRAVLPAGNPDLTPAILKIKVVAKK